MSSKRIRGRDDRPTGKALPPIPWKPSKEFSAQSNLGQFMDEMKMKDFGELHKWSVTERAAFWGKVIEKLGIVFEKKPDQILDMADGPENPRWLPGALMNCVDSCFGADPESVAVFSGREGSERIETTSLRELEELADRFAGGLSSGGYRAGDAVALYMPMNVECVAAYLGIVRAGCRVISIPDSFSADEVKMRLAIGDAKGIVTARSYIRGGKRVSPYRTVVRAGAPPAIVVGAGTGGGTTLRDGDQAWHEFLAGPGKFPSVAVDPNHISNILFSSGTTGTPKAIPWTHLTPIKCAMDGHMHQDIRRGDVVAWPTNIGWMMGPWLIYAALINGAAIALYEGTPAGDGFTRFVQEAGVTVLGVVPSLVRAWRTAGFSADVDWSGIRVFSSTGEPSRRDDYHWLMGLAGTGAPVIEYCGGTEIGGGYITGTVVQDASPSTFTTPALGIDLVVLDDDWNRAVEGETGEVFLVPPSIGLSQTLLNADHHQVYYEGCPAGPGGELLRRHGDQLALLPGGQYKAGGRADDTMNLGGIKISSIELERAIETHKSIRECAAVSSRVDGDGPELLIVFAVIAETADEDNLKKEANKILASTLNPLFKIYDLVVTAVLPRTASNKLMRRALRDSYNSSP